MQMPPKRAGTAAVGDDGKLTLQSLRKRTKAAATAESGSAQLRAIAQEIAKNPYGLLEKKEDHRTCARSGATASRCIARRREELL